MIQHNRRFPRDKQGAGGNIATGSRLVRPGGRIKFDGFYHQNDALIPYIGEYVEVQSEDAFFSEKVPIFLNYKFLCYAQNEYHRR
jgi:hypothetical protein